MKRIGKMPHTAGMGETEEVSASDFEPCRNSNLDFGRKSGSAQLERSGRILLP